MIASGCPRCNGDLLEINQYYDCNTGQKVILFCCKHCNSKFTNKELFESSKYREKRRNEELDRWEARRLERLEERAIDDYVDRCWK